MSGVTMAGRPASASADRPSLLAEAARKVQPRKRLFDLPVSWVETVLERELQKNGVPMVGGQTVSLDTGKGTYVRDGGVRYVVLEITDPE